MWPDPPLGLRPAYRASLMFPLRLPELRALNVSHLEERVRMGSHGELEQDLSDQVRRIFGLFHCEDSRCFKMMFLGS